MRYLDMDFEEF